MIFEQDFTQPHSINTNQEFMEINFQKKLVFTLVLPQNWCMVGEISFHKFLIGVNRLNRVRLSEVLCENHAFVLFEKLPLVDG